MSIGSIISFVISIFVCYCVYYCCDRYSFKTTLILYVIYNFLSRVISSSINNKPINIASTLIASLIYSTIIIFFSYKIYDRSNSFFNFLVKIICLELLLSFVLIAIGTFISMQIGANGILAS